MAWFSRLGLGIILVLAAAPAHAQEEELSVAERQAAAEAAYDRGTRAFEASDWESAARWYETAHQLAPSANALIQAMRAHEHAGNVRLAANLGLRLRARFGEERMTTHTEAAIEAARAGFTRLDITCEECELEIDGDTVAHTSSFVTPDTEHVVVARFAAGTVERRVTGTPGERRDLTLEAPEAEPEPPAHVPSPQPLPQPADDGPSGVGIGLVTTGAILAAGSGAVLVWSGLDTLSALEDYDLMPTHEKLANGRDLETRTNVLIIATSVLGITTVVGALLLADWGGDDDAVRPTAAAGPGWVAVGLTGTWP